MSKIHEHLAQEPTFVPSVVGYPVADGKILLGLRKQVSNGLGLNLISGIGGKIGDEPEFADETSDEALVREFREEIGVEVTKFRNMGRIRFIFPQKPKWNHDVTIYVIDEWTGEPVETDAIAPQWHPQDQLPAGMWADNGYWIPKVLAGEHVDVICLYNDDNSTIDEIIFEA